MEVCQVFVSSDLIGSFVVTSFAHAQHARRFPGCHLFSKLWEVPRTVRCHPQSYTFKKKKKPNKLYVATAIITCVYLFRLLLCNYFGIDSRRKAEVTELREVLHGFQNVETTGVAFEQRRHLEWRFNNNSQPVVFTMWKESREIMAFQVSVVFLIVAEVSWGPYIYFLCSDIH